MRTFVENLSHLEEVSWTTEEFRSGLLYGSCAYFSLNFRFPVLSLTIASLDIVTLALWEMRITGGFTFYHLKHLSLYKCYLRCRTDEFYLPSLRHLAYVPSSSLQETNWHLALLDGITKTRPFCSVSVPLNLDSTSIPDKMTSSSSVYYTAQALSASQYDSKPYSTERLRLSCPSVNYWQECDFDAWTRLVESGAGNLKTLVLSPPITNVQEFDGNVIEGFERFLGTCQRRQVKVVQEETPVSPGFWGLVSPYLIRESEKLYEERLRMYEENEEEEGGSSE